MSAVSEYFQQLIGAPVWGVQKGHGTAVFLEFGAPSLSIREPRPSSSPPGSKVRRLAERRLIRPVGAWSFLINGGSAWTIKTRNFLIDWNVRDDEMKEPFDEISGQYLTRAAYHDTLGHRRFVLILEFDLGGVVTIERPDEPMGDLWSVGRTNGDVVGLTEDGLFDDGPARGATRP